MHASVLWLDCCVEVLGMCAGWSVDEGKHGCSELVWLGWVRYEIDRVVRSLMTRTLVVCFGNSRKFCRLIAK